MVVVSLLIVRWRYVPSSYTAARYGNAMVQRVASGLAQQIVARERCWSTARNTGNPEARNVDRLMTLIPVWSFICCRRMAT